MFITFLDNYSPPDNGSVEQQQLGSNTGAHRGSVRGRGPELGGGEVVNSASTLAGHNLHTRAMFAQHVLSLAILHSPTCKLDVFCQHQDMGSGNELFQISEKPAFKLTIQCVYESPKMALHMQ